MSLKVTSIVELLALSVSAQGSVCVQNKFHEVCDMMVYALFKSMRN